MVALGGGAVSYERGSPVGAPPPLNYTHVTLEDSLLHERDTTGVPRS
jgi:hypothetical protein